MARAASRDGRRRQAAQSREASRQVLQRFAPGRAVTPDTTIDELGLSSLERVELMMALEEAFQVTVDEARFSAARTVADLEALTRPIDAAGPAAVAATDTIDFPSWNRSLPARALRRASLADLDPSPRPALRAASRCAGSSISTPSRGR